MAASMEYYRCCAAISLNNSAIALMERQRHYLAYETLKDALATLMMGDKAAAVVYAAAAGEQPRWRANGGIHADERHRAVIQERLDRAAKLLSSSTWRRPEDGDVFVVGPSPCRRREEPPPIVVVPATDAPSLGLLAASFRSGCHPLRVSPVRIEPTDAESIREGSDLRLARAIMLYNYSLCLRCAWRSLFGVHDGASHTGWATKSSSFPLHECASRASAEVVAARDRVRVQVLREAAEIVTTELSRGGGKSALAAAPVEPGKALSVAIVVYSAYLQALEESGEVEGAARCSAHLLTLNRALVSLFGRRIFYPHHAMASAA